MSAGPPAGNGTTRVSGLLGKGACARRARRRAGRRGRASERAAAGDGHLVSSGSLAEVCAAAAAPTRMIRGVIRERSGRSYKRHVTDLAAASLLAARALIALLVSACASPPDAPAPPSAPPLVLEQFFPGRTVGAGRLHQQLDRLAAPLRRRHRRRVGRPDADPGRGFRLCRRREGPQDLAPGAHRARHLHRHARGCRRPGARLDRGQCGAAGICREPRRLDRRLLRRARAATPTAR